VIAAVPSATLLGVEGRKILVEVHVSNGLPGVTIVGLPDAACREARDRVRAALLSSGLPWPTRRVTVNLAPSGVRKAGAGLDLAIAVGLLVASGEIEAAAVAGCAFVGELGLDGTLRVATSVYLALGAILLALAVSGRGGPLAMAAVLALMQGQSGFIAPTGMVGALHRHAQHAGSASALMGTLQFMIGCSAGFLTAWLTDGTALPMAGLMAGGALCCKLADLCRPRG